MLYLLQNNNLGKNRWKKETDQDWKQINIVWIWLWTMKLGYKSTLYKLHLGANDWRELRDISLRNEIPAVTDWTSRDKPVPEPSGGPHPIRGCSPLWPIDAGRHRMCVCLNFVCLYGYVCVYHVGVCGVCTSCVWVCVHMLTVLLCTGPQGPHGN